MTHFVIQIIPLLEISHVDATIVPLHFLVVVLSNIFQVKIFQINTVSVFQNLQKVILIDNIDQQSFFICVTLIHIYHDVLVDIGIHNQHNVMKYL